MRAGVGKGWKSLNSRCGNIFEICHCAVPLAPACSPALRRLPRLKGGFGRTTYLGAHRGRSR